MRGSGVTIAQWLVHWSARPRSPRLKNLTNYNRFLYHYPDGFDGVTIAQWLVLRSVAPVIRVQFPLVTPSYLSFSWLALAGGVAPTFAIATMGKPMTWVLPPRWRDPAILSRFEIKVREIPISHPIAAQFSLPVPHPNTVSGAGPLVTPLPRPSCVASYQ